MEKINTSKLIIEAMKSGDKVALDVYKLCHNEFVKIEKSSKDKVITYSEQVKVINKMLKQWEEVNDIYHSKGRIDLYEKGLEEIKHLRKLIPIMDEYELVKIIENIIKDYDNPTMKDMKSILSKAQEENPLIDGKLVSSILSKYIKK